MNGLSPDSERLALSGFKVLVTRDAKRAPELSERLTALGADVFEYPVIEIRPPSSPAGLDRALSNLQSYDWIIFASTSAVDAFIKRLALLNIQHLEISRCSLAAVGEKTAEHMRAHKLPVAFCPREFSATAFVQEFKLLNETTNKKFLWPRTNVGKLNIKDQLEAIGATVDVVTAYETHLPSDAKTRIDELAEWLKADSENGGDSRKVITLTSSEGARNLDSLLQSTATIPDGVTIFSIGSETHKTVTEIFHCPCHKSNRATIPALVETIKNYAESVKASRNE